MRPPTHTSPAAFLAVGLPAGMATGYVSVTLPFVLEGRGFPVATIAAMVAVAVSANLWRFLLGPLVDLTLTLRRWWALGTALCAPALLLLGLIPLDQESAWQVTAAAFLVQVATSLAMVPATALMHGSVRVERQGSAAGWFQAGSLAGSGLGGGAGVWLASHHGVAVASAALAAACAACLLALPLLAEPPPRPRGGLVEGLRETGRALRDLAGSRRGLVVGAMVASPIGLGAVSNLWGAVAPAWHAGPDTVALVSGALAGFASAGGCLVGGWSADRLGRWPTFFGAGALLALAGVAMAAAPRTELVFVLGGLAYALGMGAGNAAYSAVVLLGAGRSVPATRCALLISLGNLPLAYMTALDGWAFDALGAGAMLELEAALSLACIGLGVLAVRWEARGAAPSDPDPDPPERGLAPGFE